MNTRNEVQSQGRGSIKQSRTKENECIERGVRTMEVVLDPSAKTQ